MNSHLRHHRIHRDGAGVVGHHEGSSLIRNRLDSRNLHPEPVAIQRTNSLQQHLVCEFRVETKIVDRILAGKALPKHAHMPGELSAFIGDASCGGALFKMTAVLILRFLGALGLPELAVPVFALPVSALPACATRNQTTPPKARPAEDRWLLPHVPPWTDARDCQVESHP